MARIRSVRPEFFSDYDLAVAGNDVRVLFIALWCQADNYGVLVDDPREIASFAFPAVMQIDAARVHAWLQQLQETGKLIRYDVNGQRYIRIATWESHQRPKNPGDPRWPPPNDDQLEDARAKRRLSWERAFSAEPKLPIYDKPESTPRTTQQARTEPLPHSAPTDGGGVTKVDVEGEVKGKGEGEVKAPREDFDFEGDGKGTTGLPPVLRENIRLRLGGPINDRFRASDLWNGGRALRWYNVLALAVHGEDTTVDELERWLTAKETRPRTSDIRLPEKWLDRCYAQRDREQRRGGRSRTAQSKPQAGGQIQL